MKAIRVNRHGGPEVLQLEEVPLPEPGPGEVRVRIVAVGVNPVETYLRAGTYPKLPSLPYTPGGDGAGTVEKVGEGVADWKVGERVYLGGSLTGTYAEFALCRTAQLHRLPEAVSFEQGAGVNTPYATAYRALFQKALALPGERVLVHGASGGVGLAAVQLACAAGLRVAGTAGTAEGMKLVLAEGAEVVFDHRQPGYTDQILAWSGGRGVEVIMEMLANVNLGADLTLLGMGGRVVVIGSRGKAEITPRDAMSREASILAMTMPNTSQGDLDRIHAALGAGLRAGVVRPFVGRRFPLAAASEAQVAVMAPGALGKIVLLP